MSKIVNGVQLADDIREGLGSNSSIHQCAQEVQEAFVNTTSMQKKCWKPLSSPVGNMGQGLRVLPHKGCDGFWVFASWLVAASMQ
jgi:hypothetical protein